MKKIHIPFSETGFFSKLICDFTNSDLRLNFFNQSICDLKSIKKKIKKEKKKNNIILSNILKEQYKKTRFYTKKPLVNSNIEKIQNCNVYTITTGHQLNIFAGPLFLIYKIVSIIACAQYLNKNIKDFYFVPCFWMATEDHDFNEIQNLHLYDQNYTWGLHTEDAVGHLSSKSLLSVLDQIKHVLCVTKHGNDLYNIFQYVYEKNDNYADATRSLLTSLFGDYGLVVVDGNHSKFKRLFVDDLITEVQRKFVHSTVCEANNIIQKKYRPEINAMESNIFYFSHDKRCKIIFNKKKYFQTKDSSFVWSKSELLKEINQYPERFSPNVFLRPLYQERIMHNMIYVGGPSEISYWLQLPIMFQYRKQSFPFLALRSHFSIISKQVKDLKCKLGLKWDDLFLDYNQQIKKILIAKSEINIQAYFKNFDKFLLSIEHEFKSIDNFPINSFYVFRKRFYKEFDRLQSKILIFEKNKNSNILNDLKFLNSHIYPNNIPQERTISYIPYYIKYGSSFFDLLIRESSIFDNKYTILKEED